MTNWLQRVGALFGARLGEPAAVPNLPPSPTHRAVPHAAPQPVPIVGGAVAALGPDSAADLQRRFLEWLIGAPLANSMQDSEQGLLEQLDALATSENSLASLLPRAPAVIPQLLKGLRDQSQSAGALAQRVTRDPNLVVEVIRMANSAQARGGAPLTDITEAIQRLGTDGLRRAILRVMLKPIYGGQADSLTARCSQRLWQHSEAQAAACLQEASARGLDPFDGYVVGLMHNVGWTAALRAIDLSQIRAPAQFSLPFMMAVQARRDTLFALLVMPWQLADTISALAAELLAGGGEPAASPLGQVLGVADHRASLQMLGVASVLPNLRPTIA